MLILLVDIILNWLNPLKNGRHLTSTKFQHSTQMFKIQLKLSGNNVEYENKEFNSSNQILLRNKNQENNEFFR